MVPAEHPDIFKIVLQAREGEGAVPVYRSKVDISTGVEEEPADPGVLAEHGLYQGSFAMLSPVIDIGSPGYQHTHRFEVIVLNCLHQLHIFRAVEHLVKTHGSTGF